MKLNISDAVGSEVVGVLRLDGSPAVRNEDYAAWSGEYHKNGKWSYTEGGVALKNGIVIVNQRSTHHSGNNKKRALVVKDNDLVETLFVGRLSELPEKPQFQYCHTLPEAVFEAILTACLDYADAKTPGFKATILAQWAKMAQFA